MTNNDVFLSRILSPPPKERHRPHLHNIQRAHRPASLGHRPTAGPPAPTDRAKAPPREDPPATPAVRAPEAFAEISSSPQMAVPVGQPYRCSF